MDAADERYGECGENRTEQSVSSKRSRPFFRVIARQSVERQKPVRDTAKTYFANLNTYTHMAHYVAKVLHQRPNDILDHWGVPELIVAFGEYANEESARHYEEWKQLDTATRAKYPKPSQYAVYFHYGNEE